MRMHYIKATLPVLLAALAACTGVSPSPDSMRTEAELRADEARGSAASHTHDFERALMVAACHKR
jgi:hypothetical protein